jgi:mannose-6-phosphate isomerase-like protein (cupin superfamily)
MRRAAGHGTIGIMLDTATSVTVIHGAMLSFETIEVRDADSASVRVRREHETLLRVIDGVVTLEVGGSRRTLMLEGEARIEAGIPHRIWNAGPGNARIVQEFRQAR